MSGICGLFNLDGAPVADSDIGSMCSMLVQRGPDGTNTWRNGAAALGHTLLIATPEAEQEQQPFRHAESGCVITADVRLDNRHELLQALAPDRHADTVGDAELILLAYLQWGKKCPNSLLGDFAFAIWDPHHQHLFCARDHFGMRPLYYHHSPGQRLVFGSSPDAILVLPVVPFQINEARVADYLIQELEWVDYTCTFFDGILRLPPAHWAMISADRMQIESYWQPQVGAAPGPLSDDDWRDGLLEIFTRSVDARLRAPIAKVGSMLSGGVDSGSVVAVAKDILHKSGAGPLPTFSAVCGSAELARQTGCEESQAVYATIECPRIEPTLISPDSSLDNLELMLEGFDEPFDTGFMFLKKIYAVAASKGMCVVLDGAGGDVILGEGSYIVRLLRSGRWRRSWSEIQAENRCLGGGRLLPTAMRYGRAAFLPEMVKRPARHVMNERETIKSIDQSLVSPDLASRVDLPGRFARMRETFANDRSGSYALETMRTVLPNMTAGKERYARLAASCAIEARDPFMDKRLIEFCAHLPGHLRIEQYQHKLILRQIMDGRVPNEVAWSARKAHVGWLFNQAVKKQLYVDGDLRPEQLQNALGEWLDESALARAWRDFEHYGYDEDINTAMCLSAWLRQYEHRPAEPN